MSTIGNVYNSGISHILTDKNHPLKFLVSGTYKKVGDKWTVGPLNQISVKHWTSMTDAEHKKLIEWAIDMQGKEAYLRATADYLCTRAGVPGFDENVNKLLGKMGRYSDSYDVDVHDTVYKLKSLGKSYNSLATLTYTEFNAMAKNPKIGSLISIPESSKDPSVNTEIACAVLNNVKVTKSWNEMSFEERQELLNVANAQKAKGNVAVSDLLMSMAEVPEFSNLTAADIKYSIQRSSLSSNFNISYASRYKEDTYKSVATSLAKDIKQAELDKKAELAKQTELKNATEKLNKTLEEIDGAIKKSRQASEDVESSLRVARENKTSPSIADEYLNSAVKEDKKTQEILAKKVQYIEKLEKAEELLEKYPELKKNHPQLGNDVAKKLEELRGGHGKPGVLESLVTKSGSAILDYKEEKSLEKQISDINERSASVRDYTDVEHQYAEDRLFSHASSLNLTTNKKGRVTRKKTKVSKKQINNALTVLQQMEQEGILPMDIDPNTGKPISNAKVYLHKMVLGNQMGGTDDDIAKTRHVQTHSREALKVLIACDPSKPLTKDQKDSIVCGINAATGINMDRRSLVVTAKADNLDQTKYITNEDGRLASREDAIAPLQKRLAELQDKNKVVEGDAANAIVQRQNDGNGY